MRALLQRVIEASVGIEGAVYASINKGLLVFIGIEPTDIQEDIDYLTKKIIQLRIFSDEKGLMNKSLSEIEGSILLVSQFTLFADTRKGNRPSFCKAAPAALAIPLYEAFILACKQAIGDEKVKTGVFGADMAVSLINDGPVTVWFDTKQAYIK